MVVGAILAGSLLLLEVTLRLLELRRPPNDSHFTWGYPLHTNALGFRERAVSIPKPAGTFRIMVLGDSLTWGVGLPVERRYTALLEERLKSVLQGREIEVLNFSIPSGPTLQERDILVAAAPSVDPDLVVVGYSINDPQPRSQDYAVEEQRYDWFFGGMRQLHRLHLDKTAHFLHVKVDQILREVGLVPQWPEALDRTYDTNSPEWQAFTQALVDIVQVTRARQLPRPIFIPLLSLSGDYGKPDELLKMVLKWSRQAEEAARAAGFVAVSLEGDFIAEGYRSRWVNTWDTHPDAQCHEVYARSLAEVIAPMLTGR